MNKMNKTLQIRNSTAEFLIFTKQENKNTIEVRIEDETVWLTQKLMGILFEVSVPTINEHLANIFKTGETTESATVRKFRIVQTEGTRQVNREVEFYNLDSIIAVGFRVNSERATQFRQWAINILRDFAIRGYVLDKERASYFPSVDPAINTTTGAFPHFDTFDSAECGTPLNDHPEVGHRPPLHSHTGEDVHARKGMKEKNKNRPPSTFQGSRIIYSCCQLSGFDRLLRRNFLLLGPPLG